ncbi:MAG TPA: helix-turn-helix transcriptional regulator [Dictyoglomaceae bacterium]|nr:helix-turn-helix transcriptional regulator [Dictyoglomaceae bacterium]HOL39260.1 helix-turn-helix transcriptional regulator [Dictyoglomaceae bacterium]HPP15881.1 helix-turn-helix transcriptional regulator [Dictyoglomaceae bacterium]
MKRHGAKGTGLSPTFWLRAWIVTSLEGRELHGYELISTLSDIFPGLIPPGIGGMGRGYRILRDLENEGIVISRWDTDDSGPAKKIYRLTEDGERLREEILNYVEEMKGYIDKFLECAIKDDF